MLTVRIPAEHARELAAVFVPPPPEEMQTALSDLERFLHEADLPLLIQLAVAY